ncbi:MAG TPA: hypothetical protein VLF88_01165 [Candidatus Babeliales bacterium]|nr:hypothetical protein [Candidatus Babeliales bacterium]
MKLADTQHFPRGMIEYFILFGLTALPLWAIFVRWPGVGGLQAPASPLAWLSAAISLTVAIGCARIPTSPLYKRQDRIVNMVLGNALFLFLLSVGFILD